ncbi:MAG TPA: MarR family transcriptional regulator [Ktedonobacterales bacterium]
MGADRPDAQRLTVWQTYLRGHTAVMRALEAELQACHQLSVAEYDVLLRLNSAPDQRLRLGELAGAVLFSTGGLSRLLDRLERAGLVARERTPDDRRGVYAILTEAGYARLHGASDTHLRGIQRHFAAALSDEEIAPVSQFLTRLLTEAPSADYSTEDASADACATDAESSRVDGR